MVRECDYCCNAAVFTSDSDGERNYACDECLSCLDGDIELIREFLEEGE